MAMPSRRRFLAATALGTTALAAGGLLAVRSAAAFSLEPAGAAVSADYQAALACRKADVYHARLAVDAAAIIAGRPLTADERSAILAAYACPICGCRPAVDPLSR